MKNRKLEQTLVLIKPDALKNSLTGYVLSHLSEYHTGLRFAAAKIVHVSRILAEEHYFEHKDKVFFPSLIEFIMGRVHYPDEPRNHRVIALVYRGPGAVQKIRDIAGPTNPHMARELKPGCIRSLGTVVPITDAKGKIIGDRIDNLIHASATNEEAEREIKLWFKPDDIPPFMHAYETAESKHDFCIKGDQLSTERRKGDKCFIPSGDVAWKSDLDALETLLKGKRSKTSLNAVVAKYLINSIHEKD